MRAHAHKPSGALVGEPDPSITRRRSDLVLPGRVSLQPQGSSPKRFLWGRPITASLSSINKRTKTQTFVLLKSNDFKDHREKP